MNIISLRDYAAQKNVSYEAVRKQVRRYEAELEGHIIKDGRQQFLDDDAVAFLDAKRQKNPVVVMQRNKDDTLDELRRQKEDLLVKVAAQADQIAELAKWKADNAMALAAAEQRQLALEAAQTEVQLLDGIVKAAQADMERIRSEAEQKAAEAAQELAQARKEVLEAQEKERAARAVQEAVEAQMQALKARGFFARVFRKGE